MLALLLVNRQICAEAAALFNGITVFENHCYEIPKYLNGIGEDNASMLGTLRVSFKKEATTESEIMKKMKALKNFRVICVPTWQENLVGLQ